MRVKNKYPEKRRIKLLILICAFLSIRSAYLFVSKGVYFGVDHWKFYSSLFGAIGFLIIFIYLIKLNK